MFGKGSGRWLAVAVLVLATALAGCGGDDDSGGGGGGSQSSSAQPGKGKPAITIGDKNFTEEYILGELYAQALRAKGYDVTVKSNIGGSEITDKARTSGQIDMYPDYVGTILSVVAGQDDPPASAQETYAAAKTFEESRGFTLLEPTPFYNSNAVAVLPDYARQHGLRSVSDLENAGKFSYADTPENLHRVQGVKGLRDVYGLDEL